MALSLPSGTFLILRDDVRVQNPDGCTLGKFEFRQVCPNHVRTGRQLEEVALVRKVDHRPVLGIVDSETLIRRAKWDRDIAGNGQHASHGFTLD